MNDNDGELERLAELLSEQHKQIIVVHSGSMLNVGNMIHVLDAMSGENGVVVIDNDEFEVEVMRRQEMIPFKIEARDFCEPRPVLEDKRPYFRKFERRRK